MANHGTIHLDSSRSNIISLKSVTLDCSQLFAVEEKNDETGGVAKSYKLLYNRSNRILRLDALDPLHTRKEEEPYDDFLPTQIYVRDCMQEIFHEIVQAGNYRSTYAVVYGSPGVGKSVLSLLAMFCFTCFIQKPVLFLRKTTKRKEPISVFWITPLPGEDGKVSVVFARNVDNENSLRLIRRSMLEHIFAKDIEAGDLTRVKSPGLHLRSVCDGPRHDSVDHVADADLVTSGGYRLNKDEAWDEINPLLLPAWTLKEVIHGCRNLFNLKAVEAKEMFDLCGGNIRIITAIVQKATTLKKRKEYVDSIVQKEGEPKKLKLALESHSLSSTEDSIDRFRAMFATPTENGYTTVQYIGSPYLLRLLRSRLSLDETLSGLLSAKSSGIQSIYGWYFELFGHRIFQASHDRQEHASQEGSQLVQPACHSFKIVKGSGTGKESVKELDRSNVYWTPTVSNFANIDAAIALDRTLYCIQYTVSVSHSFSYRTFVSDFWEKLPPKFQQTISKVIVVYVVPRGVKFCSVVIPKSQERQASRITCEEEIRMVFRPARSAAKQKDDASSDKMEEDEEVDDDDCGVAGFDEEETGTWQGDPPPLHFQWETLSEEFDVDKAPLSFLKI